MRLQVTDEQREQLDSLGFFVTPKLIEDSLLGDVRQAFLRGWERLIKNMESEGVKQAGIVSPRIRPFLPDIRAAEPACMAFCFHPVFAEICSQLLGPDIDITWDQAIIKPPLTVESAFAWHQDMWYAENGDYLKGADLDRIRRNDTGITVWAAISDTTVANGTLNVLPGAHAGGLLPHIWDEQTNDWRGDYDTGDGIPVEMEAGQAIVFRRYLPHSSGGNQTDSPRMAYQIGYGLPGIMPETSPHVGSFLRGNETGAVQEA
ncbi:MAG: phytanoyl-CoA dioxygenase family protein [Planctomycetota bacterium]|nr:phytanoyl-CoA dioxygenase family protein [Planctomycetota bacterium]MDA1140963.1 phytanoyl-CoA dioxygenase family protein [Planctomycetota bacterium]